MRRICPIIAGFLLLFSIYGCSEEEQLPLEVVSKTNRLSAPDGKIKANLELPGGAKLKPEEMKIIAGEEEITPLVTGEFFIPEPEIPQMIMVLNKDEEVIFFGIIDPRKEEISIGTESTAVELVFLTCMLYALPTDLHYEALDIVTEEQTVSNLADALDRQYDHDSSASLEDIIPKVDSELTAAVRAINDEIASYIQPMAPPLEISPPQRQSGCEITHSAQEPEGQIRIENYCRRYVYAIAHKSNSKEALVTKFVGMGKPAVSFETIGQFAGGDFDFTPSVEKMELPRSHQKDQFQIDIVGPTLRLSTTELVWKKEYFISSGATVGMVYILPLIKHIIGSSVQSAFDTGFSAVDIYALFGLEVYNLIVDNRDLWDAYENQKIIRMVWHTAKLLCESETFQRVIEMQLRSSIVSGMFERAFSVLKDISISRELINAGVAAVQWGISERQVTFTAIEAEPTISIIEPSNGFRTEKRVIYVRGQAENIEDQQGTMVINGRQQIISIRNSVFDAAAILTSGNNLIRITIGGISREIKVTNTAPPTTLFTMLTWKEDESDVDLYVTEPDGQTAWFGIYGQRQDPPFVTTNGGKLDVENVEGFGPERYYISLADGAEILPGDYGINVHYYESHGHAGAVHYTILILKNEQFYDQIEGSISFANDNSADPRDAGKDTSWPHIADVELTSETGTELGEPGAVGIPDLIVRSLTIEGEATIGQPVRYTVIIENIDAGTAKNLVIRIYLGSGSDDLSNNIDQYIVPELKPGKIHTRSLSFAPVGYSASYIIAMVDPDDRIPEAQEDNNTNAACIQFHYDEREGMVFIPAGEFEMGDHHEVGSSDERPVHTVYIDGFYIDKYEVTNAQYVRFLNEYGKNTDESGNQLLDIDDAYCRVNRSGGTYVPESGYEDHPVVEVSWYGAVAYARFYGKRLPTEAEWEKAARGGLVGKIYPWGDGISHQDANYYGTGDRDIWDNTSLVGSFSPNDYDLYDMAGNVWEWCADWYDSGYYRLSPRRNPTGLSSGTYRVLRGGSWGNNPNTLRVADRNFNNPTHTYSYLGFRCASLEVLH